jgi:uncharacterized membrane protein
MHCSSRLLAAIILALGICYTVIVPPFQVPDEYMHFGRALNLLSGHLRADRQADKMGFSIDCRAAYLMNNIPRATEFRRDTKYPWQTFLTVNRSAAQQSGVCFWEIDRGSLQMHVPYLYLAQAAGIKIAQIFSASPAAWLYAGRIANLLLSVALLYMALRAYPGNRVRLFFFASLPMLLHLLGSLSADALLISLALLFFSLLLNAMKGERAQGKISWSLALTAIFFGTAKFVYFPLLLLILCIPDRSRHRAWTDFMPAGAALAVATVLLAIWSWLVRNDYYSTAIYGMDPQQQLAGILQQPVAAIKAILAGYLVNADKIAVMYFGVFGWLSVIMPLAWYLAYFTLMLLITFGLTELPATGRERWYFGTLAVAVALGLSLSMYVSFTPVGHPYTKGLQGRHLMPIAPFLFWALSPRRKLPVASVVVERSALVLIVLFNCIALAKIYMHFTG